MRGGRGGTIARLEDLQRCARALEAVADLLDQVSCRARAVAAAVEWGASLAPPERAARLASAASAAAGVDAGPAGAGALSREASRLAAGLWGAAAAFDDSENLAERLLSEVALLGRTLWGGLDLLGWAGRSLAAEGMRAALSPTRVGAWPGPLTPLVSLPLARPDSPRRPPPATVVLGFALADLIDPDGPAPVTGVLNRDSTEAALWMLTRAEHAIMPTAFIDTLVSGRELTQHAALVLAPLLEFLSAAPDGEWVGPVGSQVRQAPGGVEDLVGRIARLSPDTGGRERTIAIERIEHPDGTRAWIVEIPGTQEWSLGGDNPFDMVGNLWLMAAGASQMSRCVVDAMRQAGIRPGEPVMLAGHSQGGIAAAALASNREFTDRYAVSSVLTVGAPVGDFQVGDRISVMSLEHPTDITPGLDGNPNPAGPRHTTVSRDLLSSDDPADVWAGHSIAGSHRLDAYGRTAALVDGSDHPSVGGWMRDSAVFMPGEGTLSVMTEYSLVRVEPGVLSGASRP